jgi:MFS transporter, DHA3 family, tetracycline resistance protein
MTTLTATVLLFEIPTGVVADVYSRRLSVIIGFVLIGIGALIEGTFQVLEWILLAQVIWGIGFTFVSGARDAWIVDEIGQEPIGMVFLRGTQISRLSYMAGIPISTILGVVGLNLPIILSGILYILLAVFLIIFMPEEGFRRLPDEKQETWREMAAKLRDGVKLIRGRSILIAILATSAVYGLSGSGFDNLWTLNMLENVPFPIRWNLEPVVWFGIINGIKSVLGIAGIEIVRRRMDVNKQENIVRVLMFLTGGTAQSMVVFGLTGNFLLAVIAYCLSHTFRTTSDPILRTWINMNAESSVRAMVISMESQFNSLGQMIGGPLIGGIGSKISLRIALVIAGFVRIPVTILFGRLVYLSKGKRWEEVSVK